ncbi:hypothetical protein IKF88_00655 [Candidatus Saccharibacteria bacterium]|nr:hypothetical protein [Candidatus Saccharibacteria bacterium]
MDSLITIVLTVVLVAWFFGVSYTAALHGIISFIFWSLAIGAVLYVLWYLFAPLDTPPEKPKPQPKPIKEVKPFKIPPVVKWITFFIISYLFSIIFMAAIGLAEACIKYKVPIVIEFAIPTLPFVVVLVCHIIKSHIKPTKKRTHRKAR